MTVSILGGLLGILFMIRCGGHQKQHGKLKYPEGTAAEVLIAGEKAGPRARW